MRRVRHDDELPATSRTAKVFHQARCPLAARFSRDHLTALPPGRLTECDRFPSWRGAGVEYDAPTGVGEPYHQGLGWFLDEEIALDVTGQPLGARTAYSQPRTPRRRLESDAITLPASPQGVEADTGGVRGEDRPGVVPGQQALGLRRAEPRHPALDQPLGMREAAGNGVIVAACRGGAQAAQHGVDEARCAGAAHFPGQVHAGADRRVHRHAVQ